MVEVIVVILLSCDFVVPTTVRQVVIVFIVNTQSCCLFFSPFVHLSHSGIESTST